jgi:hypothetical protein
VIQQDEKTVIFEWRDSGCGGFEPQHELSRVTIEKDGLYRLAYAAKVKGPLPDAQRKEWLAILGQVPLAEGTAGGPTSEDMSAVSTSKLITKELAAAVHRRGGMPRRQQERAQGPDAGAARPAH